MSEWNERGETRSDPVSNLDKFELKKFEVEDASYVSAEEDYFSSIYRLIYKIFLWKMRSIDKMSCG